MVCTWNKAIDSSKELLLEPHLPKTQQVRPWDFVLLHPTEWAVSVQESVSQKFPHNLEGNTHAQEINVSQLPV
jgi:hypothetical protein